MGELVTGDDHLHAEVAEEVLVVVAPAAADDCERGFALQDFPVLVEDGSDPGGLPLDDLLGLPDKFLVAETPGHLAQ